METKTYKFSGLYNFAHNNGYLVAEYKLSTYNGKYYLKTYDVMQPDDDFDILTRAMIGSCIDFAVTNTPDLSRHFVLHNTYDLAKSLELSEVSFT